MDNQFSRRSDGQGGLVHAFAVIAVVAGLLAGPGAPDPPADPRLAARVLHAWDARRAAAWASADTAGLTALYEHGSGAGRRDVRLLRAYAARDLVVRRMVTQVLELSVVSSESGRLRLRVVDRVAGGEVFGGGRARPLGTSRPVLRVLELKRVDDRWLVVSVRA